MSELKEIKKTYYSRPQVVARYEEKRFRGRGGAWVNRREIDACLAFLPQDAPGRVLDAPAGTGRLSQAMLEKGICSTGLDASVGMIAAARERVGDGRILFAAADLFQMPFPSGTFGISFCIRFTFHTTQLEQLFAEEMRILKPGGLFVFDTIRWSPRTWLPSGKIGRVVPYSDKEVERTLKLVGADLEQRAPMFALPSFAYAFLPDFLFDPFRRLEDVWPQAGFSRVFWLARKR
ncbi:MAG: class I SAM-dependent methyltransferase [Syntrophales bacterium]|jgi:SAM-dependent methyltransferase|nr:class I SAM-dependent methyltransferase [Syntrophales bacterium]